MPVGEASEIIALSLVGVVHVIGAAALVWALIDEEQRSGWRRRWRRRGDGRPQPPPIRPRPSVAARPPLPLADSSSSPLRLREPAREGDAHPRPARRLEHPSAPAPGRRVGRS